MYKYGFLYPSLRKNVIAFVYFPIFTFFSRVTPESDIEDDLDGSVLSLGLFPGEYLNSRESVSTAAAASKFQYIYISLIMCISDSGKRLYICIT